MSTSDDIELARASRKAQIAAAKSAQRDIDMQALNEAELEHGDDNVRHLQTTRFVEGLPTIVVYRAPTAPEYKRYTQQIRNAVKSGDIDEQARAQEQLGAVAIVYPPKDQLVAMREKFPGIVMSVALHVAELVEAQKVNEGKG
jgi:hypothetical protein